jgi:hypothetical protein
MCNLKFFSEAHLCALLIGRNLLVCLWHISKCTKSHGSLAIAICQIATQIFRAAALLLSCILQVTYFFLISVTIKTFHFPYTGWDKSHFVFMFRSWKALSSYSTAVFVKQLMNCVIYWFLEAVSVFCNVMSCILIYMGIRYGRIWYL